MSRRTLIREFRKEALLLQAEQYRMVLRQELISPASRTGAKIPSEWLETLGSVLGAVLPARWGRWLNVGLSAWHIGKRVIAKATATPAD